VVVDDDVVGVSVEVTMICDSLGARMTNFNSRERVTAKMAKMINEMAMILFRRWFRHLYR
jgi:hypothetical protein